MKSLEFKVTPEVRDDSFVKEIAKMRGGENVLDCIQCGVCSGSCHARFAMDYTPMQIIKMIHLGLKEKVLSSRTIWICASCYACATRCPRNIDIPLLMSALKQMSMKSASVSEGEVKARFHKDFTEIIRKYGRIYEPELKMRLISKTDLGEIYRNTLLALRLWRRGKIKVHPVRIKGIEDLSRIFESSLKEG